MTCVEQMSHFVVRASYEDLSTNAREQLKIRVLDSLGCGIGAVEGEPTVIVRKRVADFDTGGKCTLIGGGCAAPDRAAFYNGALIRYLDFNDSYLAKGETCHPSDNVAPLLAAAEYAAGSGRDFMTALATAYQIQCRLSDVAPVRAAGFDHTVQGSYAVASGVAKMLGLAQSEISNALAISGTAFNALRVTRTGRISHWKGLAYPNMGACSTFVTFLAKDGITGPLEVFEGDKGFMDAIGGFFEIDWSREDLERVNLTVLKKYNAEVHSQTAIEGILELRRENRFTMEEIERIDIDTFEVAYHIIGGGEEGDKTLVTSKEQADHSLPYLIAVAILDGQVKPAQYDPLRIESPDVQRLLGRITVHPQEQYSARFPNEMPCRITVNLRGGQALTKEVRDYAGFRTRPMSWSEAFEKFQENAAPYTSQSLQSAIGDAVSRLDSIAISELMSLLCEVRIPPGPGTGGKRQVESQ